MDFETRFILGFIILLVVWFVEVVLICGFMYCAMVLYELVHGWLCWYMGWEDKLVDKGQDVGEDVGEEVWSDDEWF